MNIGALRQFAKLYSKETTRDPEDGSSLEQYSFFADTYASIEPFDRGRELYIARTFGSEVTHTITIRYIRGVKADMVLEHDGVRYDIKSVADRDIRHETLVLFANTGISNV